MFVELVCLLLVIVFGFFRLKIKLKMSDQTVLKDNTKTELRAVLNSTPECLPLNRLHADYRRLVGHDIPHRDMGYDTLAEFVKDIPDVITCWMSHGQLMTKAVADKSTERITSLVARQRNNPRNRPASNMMPCPKSHEKREPPKPVQQTNSSDYHILRGRIQELLYAYKSGIKLSQFMEAYAKRFGQYVNLLSIGFTSIHELLESMKDIVDIKPIECSDFMVQSKWRPTAFQGFCIVIYDECCYSV